MNEASARIKIRQTASRLAILRGPKVPPTSSLKSVSSSNPELDAIGDDFEHIKSKRGVVDFLLLDESGFSLVVPKAKSAVKSQMSGTKEAIFGAMTGNVASATEVKSMAIPLPLA